MLLSANPEPRLEGNTSATLERHYRIKELRQHLPLSDRSLRRLFYGESGIVTIEHQGRGKRTYRTVLIPESVVRRVLARNALPASGLKPLKASR